MKRLSGCALLAAAVWQKVRDVSPYLLDPTAAPRPRLALLDGLVAALAFFVLQGLAAALVASVSRQTDAASTVTIAFGLAFATVLTLGLAPVLYASFMCVATPPGE